jgi:hypothetical protein
MTAPHFTLAITCFSAPVQMEGTVGEHRWYYRERHDRWRLEIDDEVVAEGKSPDIEVDEEIDPDERRRRYWRPDFARIVENLMILILDAAEPMDA